MPYHKLCVIGKLVSDPKSNEFQGGRVAKFGLPIDFSRRKKNPQTGEWEGDSFIINVDVFNREGRPLADWVMQSLKKGSQVYVEGRLKNNEYTDRNGIKVSRPVLVADVLEFLDARGEGSMEGGGMRGSQPAPMRRNESAPAPHNGSYDDDMGAPAGANRGVGGDPDDIPF